MRVIVNKYQPQPSGFGRFKNKREQDYRSGHALQAHKISAHKGQFDPECPACLELYKKVDSPDVTKII